MNSVITVEAFRALFDPLAEIGRGERGWNRFAWTDEDRQACQWFIDAANARNMVVERDSAGNLWAWFGTRRDNAIVTGSHLDTVPDGGAYDGALGIICGFLAVDELRQRFGADDLAFAVVAFSDEEGALANTPCFGSRVLVGTLEPEDVLDRPSRNGGTLREAIARSGLDPTTLAPDDQLVDSLRAFVEVHVEQGRNLAPRKSPLGVATAIWPHGRWRLECTGEANHAGTTDLEDRHDVAVVVAEAVSAARELAAEADALATVGRIQILPGGTNIVPSTATAWLDARAESGATLVEMVSQWTERVTEFAKLEGVDIAIVEESFTSEVEFDDWLFEELTATLVKMGLPETTLGTGAGHDAGALAAAIPTGMIFVRNPTGVSHAPSEGASDDDCVLGAKALALVVQRLSSN
jgi:N-carbamoyl-L-amino-acid hydrolase